MRLLERTEMTKSPGNAIVIAFIKPFASLLGANNMGNFSGYGWFLGNAKFHRLNSKKTSKKFPQK